MAHEHRASYNQHHASALMGLRANFSTSRKKTKRIQISAEFAFMHWTYANLLYKSARRFGERMRMPSYPAKIFNSIVNRCFFIATFTSVILLFYLPIGTSGRDDTVTSYLFFIHNFPIFRVEFLFYSFFFFLKPEYKTKNNKATIPNGFWVVCIFDKQNEIINHNFLQRWWSLRSYINDKGHRI